MPLPRNRRGKGRRYVADVVERVRVLIVGTTWSEAAIAARVGVGVATVHGWKVKRGWQRPAGTSVSTRKVAVSRAGFTRRCREVLRRVERAAAEEVLRYPLAGDDRPRLVRAVAIVLRTRAALPPARARPAWERLRGFASREAARLEELGEGEGEAARRLRALAERARQALYRAPWRPKEDP